MASLKDIAVECGVSVATVSKALNGHKEISESTAAKVLSAAEKLGYMPNSAARALKTNRTYNLGVLFVDETRSGLTHEYFSTVLDSFKVEAEANGYDITFINHNIGSRTASYLEHCRYRGVDGVVIACVDFFDPQVMELVHSDIPVVTIDHTFDNHVSVLSDNIQGMHDLVQYVYSMGHRRIAFIHGENTSVTTNRLTSFYRTCLEFGLEPPDEYVRAACYHDTHKAARCTQELLALPQPPTCILFPDDFSYIGGMNVLWEAGRRVPEDISVAGYDGIYLSQVLSPKLTTLKQDTTALGRIAAQQLIDLVERPKTTLPGSTIVPGRVLEGATVKRIGK
ncbi:LacI family DNA-binding transcriptional regulator [Caproicibacterium amylolyticum]|uniref:LacI family DNA-binding transcriptional regulator n=1 Tax=Caproicibacterium amylolyticum TaxID=2766537 RepID=A0A7G9WES6_9FIRM|nr:LacI family DNA-binding transcriptional regulator [Caproicibacterium amylolyticum]QNO17188.1 LacI family DNA-binding transcriptional regulator [Caproicibacterium amylolyticum]